MSKSDSNQTNLSSQVHFSKEILEYFKSIETPDNKEWIEKYFEILSDPSNITSEKYNKHHIRPCFTFKDENHKCRKETKPLADKFNGNLIKLSVSNHLLSHYFIWKIFNNIDSKVAFQRMYGRKNYRDNLTEEELKTFAVLKEECSNKNKTEEEIKLYNKLYAKSDKRKKVLKKFYENSKHKQSYIYSREKYNQSNKAKERKAILNKRRYFDPITTNFYSHKTIIWRFKQFPSLYKEIELSQLKCISIDDKEYIDWKQQFKLNSENHKKEWYANWITINRQHINELARIRNSKNKEKLSVYKKNCRNRKCFDPIKQEECTYGQLECRKQRNKECYKNVIIKMCLI